MTQHSYRRLVLASLVLGLIGGLIDLVVPSLVPEVMHQAQQAHDEAMSNFRFFGGLALALPALATVLAATYGLYRFRYWAPRLGLFGTALSLVALPVLGSAASSGLSQALTFLSAYTWGACLVLAHVSPYQSWFTQSAPVSREA
jgi:hypothetical protein